MTKALESTLYGICQGFFFFIRALDWITNILVGILRFLIMLVAFVAVWQLISSLPIFWQSVILKSLILGGAFMFLCIIVLRFWKPKKFFQIFK